tara:strand:- start:25 stop:681 length:657 start_codon:yes stop_codon:yes gene_type:complete
MATSADTLAKIIKELVKKHPDHDYASAVAHLGAKGYLPKKLTQTPKIKEVSQFASPAAKAYASQHTEIVIPDDFKGTAKHGLISVTDLKTLTAPKKIKQNLSPKAREFVEENRLQNKLHTIKGTGVDGKFKLEDVKRLKPDAPTPADTRPKRSAEVSKLMKKYRVDEETLVDPNAQIVGTGKNGTIIKRDIMPFIKELKEDEEECDTEDGSSEEEDED